MTGKNFIAEDTGDRLKPGHYRHYKGRDYQVIGIAKHSETGEQLVVYRCLYGEYGLWVRPRAMFQESVELGGETVPRFSYVGPMGHEQSGERSLGD